MTLMGRPRPYDFGLAAPFLICFEKSEIFLEKTMLWAYIADRENFKEGNQNAERKYDFRPGPAGDLRRRQ